MSFKGVTTNKVKGGLVRAGDTSDRTLLMVVGAVAVAGKLEHYKPEELNDITDLEAMGVSDVTDLANKELLYYHLSEIFRLSPESPVYVMTVPKEVKISELCVKEEFLSAIRQIDGINVIGIAGVAADAEINPAVLACQKMVDDFFKEHLYLDAILLEGLGSYLKDISDPTDLREIGAENVSVIIAQDPVQAKLHADFGNHAAVGSAMGMLSVRYVHENIGSVDIENHPRTAKGTKDYPLTNKVYGKWLSACLSDGTVVTSLTQSVMKKLTEKGYIFVGSFQGYAGYFFSNSPTCTDKESPYAYIEYNCIWNKASRIIRNTLIPRVRSKVQADPATGYIKSTTISDWDARVRASLEPMVAAGDVADFDIYINPKQVAVSDKAFSIQVKLVADGIVQEFEVDLGFTNKI